MVAYNFQKQFAEAVATGEKTQTIRAFRKRHASVNEPIQLYTGMRSKACRKLVSPDPVCITNVSVIISRMGAMINGQPVEDLEAFARDDGFEDYLRMVDFFQEAHGTPFEGRLIRWELRK